MVLEELTLNNFCSYLGEQTMQLAPTRRSGRHRPITLFGGINGGGKTTILDAIQLALYGPKARCSKRGTIAYESFLRECINRNVPTTEGAGIALSFRYVAEGEEHLYEVRRCWRDNNGKIRETLEVSRDGIRDKWLSDNWQNIVEELIPIGVSSLFFFDAEQIRFLAEDETGNDALGVAIKALLGLDITERLISDAKVLEGRLAKELPTEAGADDDLESLEARILELEEQKRNLSQEKASCESYVQRATEEMRRAEEQFARAGGAHWEKRSEQQAKAAALESQETALKQQLLLMASSDAPLIAVEELLKSIAAKDRAHQNSERDTLLTQMLNDRDSELVARLRTKIPLEAAAIVESELTQDRESRRGRAAEGSSYDLSDRSRSALRYLIESGIGDRRREAQALLDGLNDVVRNLEAARRALAATPHDDAIREVSDRLTAAAKELGDLEAKREQANRCLQQADFALETASKQREKIARARISSEVKSEETLRLAKLAQQTQEIMSRFLLRSTEAKIDRLAECVSEACRVLFRKGSLVNRVEIDPGSFAITLIDGAGRRNPKQRLSEGEKQIFAISVLWGLARASTRPLPAIIDTPMARLDSTHRDRLVDQYFPNVARQVIILSTDTEIDKAYYEKLEKHLARAYYLDFSEQTQVTTTREGYFWKHRSEASSV